MSLQFDVAIIGAGAAGLFCAGVAGQRGLRVLLIDHYPKVGEKIRISGGGRCNFTNREASPANFISENPHFCKSALAQFSAQDFIALVQRYRIPFHEKHKGQLFCDESSERIIELLLAECDKGDVTRWQPCSVTALEKRDDQFFLDTTQGTVSSASVVIATGGLPVERIGASDFGLRIAKQFGLPIVEPRAALVPLTFDAQVWQPFADLAGIALPVRIQLAPSPASAGEGWGEGKSGRRIPGIAFDEDLLFTHRGLSGPAVLQISSYWREGDALQINLLPGHEADALLQLKQHSRKTLLNALCDWLPERLAQAFITQQKLNAQQRIAEFSDKALAQLQQSLTAWRITPSGTEGYKKAEVMAGGVATSALSSRTMEAQSVKGLYFIGEVVDVTGWLGGYNFQWAWSSAHACAMSLELTHVSTHMYSHAGAQ